MSKEVVRAGYDAIADAYTATRNLGEREWALLEEFASLLLEGSDVLDAGCGGGVPIARRLSRRFAVTGVDISRSQIELARRLVPGARFLCEDVTRLELPAASLDGICSFYAIIHIPREEHRGLLQRFARFLRPGGVMLLCMGAQDWAGEVEEGFFGAQMYWSHFDADTNLEMVRDCGFEVLRSELVLDNLDPERGSRHLFVLARMSQSPQRDIRRIAPVSSRK